MEAEDSTDPRHLYPTNPKGSSTTALATPAVSLVPSQPKRRICMRKPLQIWGWAVGKHRGGVRRDPHTPHGTIL